MPQWCRRLPCYLIWITIDGVMRYREIGCLKCRPASNRATFILLPLLGLHYVVMPFRPEPGGAGEIAYQIVSAVFTSFQVGNLNWLLNPFSHAIVNSTRLRT